MRTPPPLRRPLKALLCATVSVAVTAVGIMLPVASVPETRTAPTAGGEREASSLLTPGPSQADVEVSERLYRLEAIAAGERRRLARVKRARERAAVERQRERAAAKPVTVPSETVRFVSSNLKATMAPSAFAADYSRLLSFKPDFLALQEVNRRSDAELAREGYEIYRSWDSPFTAETPVLWHGGRWEALSTGTRYLTTRKVKWGVRAVNWATLRSRTTRRVVSIVSAHPAPTIKVTRGLLPEFLRGLHGVVEELAREGEVLVGGDFNVGYGSPYWRQAGFASSPLRSTYDSFGRPPGGTGDKFGHTIDYMFGLSSETLTPTEQGKWEQESDHDAIWSTWTLAAEVPPVRTDAFGELVLSPLE